MKFSISEINQILGNIDFNGSAKRDLIFSKVSIDSRTISSEDLFIALKGENFDGHDFLKTVLKLFLQRNYTLYTQACVSYKFEKLHRRS